MGMRTDRKNKLQDGSIEKKNFLKGKKFENKTM